jgi:signal transduction histidine kinase
LERSNIRLTLTIDASNSDNLLVMGSSDELTQVMFNLLSNAAKHTSGGSVTVSMVELAGGLAKIIVADTGSGISDKDIPRVFERYWHGDANGTGLGLTLCREIIEAHNGSIELKSTVGRGTTVSFTLPVVLGETG